MIARSVHHLSFSVRDLERSRRFYEGLLGLEPIPRPELGVPGAWYRAGAAEVHLIQAPEGVEIGTPPPRTTPLADHSAFAIDDYAGTLALLRERGVPVVATSPEAGQMWIADPDGHVIELIEPAAAGRGR